MRSIVVILIPLLLILPIVKIDADDPSQLPVRDVQFIDVAQSSFDDLARVNFISASDWNNDGYTDLLFNGYRLFKNNGPPSWNFTLQQSIFGTTISGAVNGVFADWDGDGDLDLYQGCRKGTADRFWENQGSPDYRFVDVSMDVFGSWENLGPNTGNAWGDHDGDGDLDLYIGSGEDWNDGSPIYYPDHFLRNEGGNSFTDITSFQFPGSENLYSRGVTWGDYDNDHDQDVYVSHYRIRENHLLENDGNGGFEEVGDQRNCSGTYDTTWYYDSTAGSEYGQSWWGPTYGHTIGSSWADFNRDGNLDLWTSDFVHKYVGYIGDWYDIRGYVCDDGNLYINDGAPGYSFTDYRNSSGIPKWPIGGQGTYRGDQTFSGVTIGDYDNDGWEDIYIPQVYGDLSYTTPHLYHNRGKVVDGSVPDGTRFEDVTDTLGIKGANTYACMYVDYDNDGDLDLLTGGADTWDGSNWQDYRVRLYQNQGTGTNSFLKIDLRGGDLNPRAVGARVVLRIGESEEIMTREVRAGTGHAHQGSSILHFGLGDIDIPETELTAEVHWTDGLISTIEIDEVDRTLVVEKPMSSGPEPIGWSLVTADPKEDTPVTIQVDFDPGDSPITNYLWDTDMDNRFDLSTPQNSLDMVYHNDGLHHIRCRAVDTAGLSGEVYPVVIDIPNHVPEIDIDALAVNMDEVLEIGSDTILDTPSDLANLTWKLDWGDGYVNQGSGPLTASHVYTQPGLLQMRIDVFDGTDTVNEMIWVNVLNVAPWGWLEIKVDNSSTHFEDQRMRFFPHIFDTPSDDSDFQLNWDFDDGTEIGPTSVSDLVHSYAEKGEYIVELHVEDEFGGIGTITRNITVLNQVPGLELSDPSFSTLRIDEDQILSFDDVVDPVDSDSDLFDLSYKWEYGDASRTEWIGTPDIDHVYDLSGTYQAVCYVMDDDGDTGNITIIVQVENPPPEMKTLSQFAEVWEDQEFQIDFTADDNPSDEESLNFFIDLGDGRYFQAGSGVQVSYPRSGDYEISVTVVDDDGDQDSMSSWITVKNRAPSGEISSSAISVDEDEVIFFTASSITDSTADISNISVRWDFNDGTEELAGMNVSHIFIVRGKYDVQMLIFDGDETTVITRTITVNNPVPVADFSFSPASPFEGDPVLFDASNTTDNPSDMGYLSYFWDMGDGTTEEGSVVEHKYGEPGTYTVVLEVVDDDSSSSFLERDIEVILSSDPEQEGKDDPSALPMIMVIIAIAVIFLIGGILIMLFLIRRRSAKAATTLEADDRSMIDTSSLMKENRTPEQIYNRGLPDEPGKPPGI